MINKKIDIDFETLEHKTGSLKEHYHNGYEIIFITKGKSSFTINDKKHIFDKNSLVFLNNLERHKMDLIETPYSRHMLIIDSIYLDSIIKDPILLSIFKSSSDKIKDKLTINNEHVDFIVRTFQELNSIFDKKNEFWEIEFTSKLITLVVFLYREYKDLFPLSHISKRKQKILEVQSYIDENFRKDITLDNLASNFYISKYYLSHSYKEITGFTIKQYILLKRISYAKSLLYHTDRSITDIAMECGFNSQSNFIRSFSKKEKLTPLQFRKYYQKIQITF
ncbi:AraC family transcriptional regulator [Schnuerera sp. xch1]|uniref:AraC family transcriptional regulator n=1 Tax=Schnuerera sp. xch1 TaxID=2874283 RepID=UPI001CBFEB25|nr:AraC family transcriptional regulator [Schnuerera sp. xch1]MBZ2174072.1 AraC family transcriptional regulator [Schnuerera sp. xch1]